MSKIRYAVGDVSCVAEGAIELGDAVIVGTAWPQVKKATAATDYVFGVAAQAAADSGTIKIYFPGFITTMRASAEITAGVAVTPVTDGEVATAASAGQAFGVSLDGASAENAETTVHVGGLGWLLA